ncbi:hypothetical protein [Aquimarina sp. RZ0]|uniref:hypothetical protein n=1 Tax=Aquimarina sp. RZ0 TaxID=2607730 RepID=UPI0011F153B7|nr:hypothetical protein [Aquimarina sp. RZ0]KAA1244682.1 hypothetical protein F0000_15665 [Aquimarina sp. RZ0]
MTSIKHKWFYSIDDLNPIEWNILYQKESFFKSYEFTKVIEKSKLDGVECFYLALFDDLNNINSLIPCYKYSLKLDVLAGNVVKKIVEKIRIIFSDFFSTKLFLIGSPVATCENHIVIDTNYYDAHQDEIFKLLTDKSDEVGAKLMMFKEIPKNELKPFELFFNKLKIFESLANSFIPIFQENYEYPKILRRRYRQRFKSAIKESSKNNYKWEVLEEYGHLSDEIYSLYKNVYDKSQYKFEKLNSSFFKNSSIYLANNSFILTCRNKDNKLICAEFVIEGENELIPMYLGLDYNETTNSSTYYNVIFRTIQEAEKRGKKFVVLGQTSYTPKAYSGAIFERLYLGFYSTNKFMTFILNHFFKYLFPEFEKPQVNNILEDVKKSSSFQKLIIESGRKFE